MGTDGFDVFVVEVFDVHGDGRSRYEFEIKAPADHGRPVDGAVEDIFIFAEPFQPHLGMIIERKGQLITEIQTPPIWKPAPYALSTTPAGPGLGAPKPCVSDIDYRTLFSRR